jgi:hypothetical protein
VPEITQPTSDAVVTAMAKDPNDRFQSYDEFIMALTSARSQLLVQKFRSQSQSSRSSGRRWWWS